MKSLIYILFFLTAINSGSIAQNIFAKVSLHPKEVYAGQSAKVTIKVFTSTWFTSGVEFEDLKIEGAFLVPYQRNTPISEKIKGNTYAGVEFFFLLFPYESGQVNFPQLNITVTTPPPGDYKGVKRRIKTKAININVKELPEELKNKEWYMVANSISVKEKWDKSLNDLKTGDVITRTISVRANATLPNFIPDPVTDSLDFAAVYPEDFKIFENKRTQNVYGTRTDKIKYLLTKEGEFTIPGMDLFYLNPISGKISSRSVKSTTIRIKLNEDLAYAQSMQDSLDAFLKSQISTSEEKQKADLKILGLKIWQLIILTLIISFILFHLIKYLRSYFRKIRIKKEQERNTEKYLFSKMENKSLKKDLKAFYLAFSKWKQAFGIDKFTRILLKNPELNRQFNLMQISLKGEHSDFEPGVFVNIIKLELSISPSKSDLGKINP